MYPTRRCAIRYRLERYGDRRYAVSTRTRRRLGSSRRDETLAAGADLSEIGTRTSKIAMEMYPKSTLRLSWFYRATSRCLICGVYASAPQAWFKQEGRDARRRRRPQRIGTRTSKIEAECVKMGCGIRRDHCYWFAERRLLSMSLWTKSFFRRPSPQ